MHSEVATRAQTSCRKVYRVTLRYKKCVEILLFVNLLNKSVHYYLVPTILGETKTHLLLFCVCVKIVNITICKETQSGKLTIILDDCCYRRELKNCRTS